MYAKHGEVTITTRRLPHERSGSVGVHCEVYVVVVRAIATLQEIVHVIDEIYVVSDVLRSTVLRVPGCFPSDAQVVLPCICRWVPLVIQVIARIGVKIPDVAPIAVNIPTTKRNTAWGAILKCETGSVPR